MSVEYQKWEALGNDFILVPAERVKEGEIPDLARRLCDREAGVGADGLLVTGRSECADLRVRVINADGSEARISGNGIRCAAAAAWGDSGVGSMLRIECGAGIIDCELLSADGARLTIASLLGPARFEPEEIPFESTSDSPLAARFDFDGDVHTAVCLSVGNPHAVFLGGRLPDRWEEFGSVVENDPRFPQRTNVEFVQVLSDDRLAVRVWERGVGRTASSGTGATAAFAASRKRGMVGRAATVGLEGGELVLEESGPLYRVVGSCSPVPFCDEKPGGEE